MTMSAILGAFAVLVGIWLAYAAYRRAGAAEQEARNAGLVGEFLMDRCGVSVEELDRWHREQHPGCFHGHHDEPEAGR